MKLECDTFYFYNNGEYRTQSKWNIDFDRYHRDVQPYTRAIRILGTKKQIREALDYYCEASGLNLDEVYTCEDKEAIKEYTKHYKNKGLIINLIQ